MLNFFVRIINRVLLNRRIKKHVIKLNSSCIYGKEFCTSPTYKNMKSQFLSVKINNKTNKKENIKIGDYCNISINLNLNQKGSVIIGDYVYMNSVYMRIDYHLKIGSHCMFGPNVKLWDTKSHPLDPKERHKQCEFIAHHGYIDSYESGGGDIIIGNDVWIGMDCTILGGVTIGNGSVIAAGSIVTKSIPENVLVGGIPARVIKNI
jgi:acetyltransferase-like isoleucine patch superfamily enzyme